MFILVSRGLADWNTYPLHSKASPLAETHAACLKLDTNGYPHLAYYSRLNTNWNWELWYSEWTGSEWITRRVAQDCSYVDMELSNGMPHLVYLSSYNSTVKYACWNGTDWTTETVLYDMYRRSWKPSLVLNNTGQPRIAFEQKALDHNVGTHLRYAYKNPSWTVDILDDSQRFVGRYNDMAIDGQGHVRLAYYGCAVDGSADTLKIAWEGAGWSNELVRTEELSSRIAVDNMDNVHLSYVQGSDLKHAVKSNGVWTFETPVNGAALLFLFSGTDETGVQDFHNYVFNSGYTNYSIPLQSYCGGAKQYLVFRTVTHPLDWRFENSAYFRNVTVNGSNINFNQYTLLNYGDNSGSGYEILDSGATLHLFSGTVAKAIELPAGIPANATITLDFQADVTGSWFSGIGVDDDLSMYGSLSYPALVIATNDAVHMSYMRSGALCHAARNGSSWSVEQAVGGTNHLCSLAVDAAGSPHIVYLDNDGNLVYTRKPARGWGKPAGTPIGTYNWYDWMNLPNLYDDNLGTGCEMDESLDLDVLSRFFGVCFDNETTVHGMKWYNNQNYWNQVSQFKILALAQGGNRNDTNDWIEVVAATNSVSGWNQNSFDAVTTEEIRVCYVQAAYAPSIYEIEFDADTATGFPALPDAPLPPITAVVTNPANNMLITLPADLLIEASAPQSGIPANCVTQVDFYAGTTLLASDSESPWSYVWSNVLSGVHDLTVQAWDENGQVWTSAAVNIQATYAPTVSITNPLNGTVAIWKPTNTIYAAAGDADGTVTQVAFYTGTTLLGNDTTSPYSWNWVSLPLGTNQLTAKAWDDFSVCSTSAIVNLVVTNVPPTVRISAPTNGSVRYWKVTNTITAVASDPDGTVTQVSFYASTTRLGVDTTSPYSFAWYNAPAGVHPLTARVCDNNGMCRTSAVVNLTITNTPPTITLTAPTNGSFLYWKTTNALTATATDPDGTVTQVAFYTGTALIGVDTTSPYSFNWTGGKAGVNALTARAWDNSRVCRTSAVVNVTITNRPPTGSITNPISGRTFAQPASVTINAVASDPDGSVTQVVFYAGTSNLGVDTTSPYSVVWNNVKAGAYSLTVRIGDNSGQFVTSSVVSITVTNNRPSVSITSPTNNATFLAPASITINANASDTDGTVTQVVFYAGTSNLGADAASPYSIAWLNVGSGSYALTARAFDNNGGISTSTVINVSVTANAAPTTSITSPANGALFTPAPANVTINANASDSDGSVTQVVFYSGSTPIGTDTSSPYSYLWSSVGEGSYSLTTRAFDNSGNVRTSAAVNITVRNPPAVSLTSPGSGSSYVAPANISLSATATSGGTITQVVFYSGSTPVGTDTSSPYSYTWNNVSTGVYVVMARAWDNTGLMNTSATASVTVVAPSADAGFPTNGLPLYVNAHPSVRKPINPRIYGINIANWCQAYYLKLCTPMLTNARISVVRYGATNIERYNWRNNRMYNVISKENQYVPTSWRSFIEWVKNDVKAEPFLQTAVFGHVASDVSSNYYSYDQTSQDIIDWVMAAGTNVQIWGVGNEPFIAWKITEYKGARTNGESYAYNDGAHGDQIYNEDIYHDTFFSNYIRVASAIRSASSTATILGPTPANWWLYWGTDFSAFCAAKRNNPGAHFDDNGWYMMANAVNQADPRVFPERVGSADVVGWEMDEITGQFNDHRNLCQFAKRMGEYAATHGGAQICNYMDFHRYMNTANDATAVQETRDLWDPDYMSFDKETGGSGTKTKILVRFNNIINHYYTNMYPSLSEYDFFYWQGHPDEMQISALGQVDYLGIFPRQNVQMACNWYIGEPDQSGGGYEHAADAAKQAMFKEDGEPNPKYWALKLMSTHFRDQSLQTIASDNSQFSIYAGLETSSSQLTVVAAYKGQYVPWWDEHHAGAFIEGQGNSNAMIVVSNFNITGVSKVLRYGRRDPGLVMMAPGGVRVTNNTFCYEFEPLSIYLFQFNGTATPPAEQAPATYLNVEPKYLNFGPYGSGSEQVRHHDEHTGETWYTTNFTHTLKITNNRNSNTTWQIHETCPWLAVVGPTSGVVTITDVIPLIVTNRSLAVGVYSANVQVVTSEGTMMVPVTMEIIPGAANGEKQLFDAETKSLAHTWSLAEPYSIGFYDGHGNPEDMDGPYVYDFSMDHAEKSGVGGTTSMRIDFDRGNGDNAAGKLYSAFGTYGHTNGTMVWVPTNGNPADYVFKFDIKTKTEGPGFTSTKLLIVVSDYDGHKGKPKVGITSFKDCMEIQDGSWQTVSIPLNSLFYNWAYPSGQDGSYAAMNFAKIKQVEFCPWVGAEDKRGTMWLDNIRIETLNTSSNKYPMAVAGQSKRLIGTNETVALTATNSYDPDGTIAAYAWSPATGLSATNVANPTFTPPGPGIYTYELVVTDNQGLKSRNPAQAVIKTTPTLVGSSIQFYRDAGMTQVITNPAANCLDVYVKLICSAGGMAGEADFTLATVSSTDTYPADTYNNVNPVNIVLNETGLNTKIFTGHFRLAAFSDEATERIGFKEGCTVKAACSGVTNAVVIGSQSYGFEKMIDYVERGDKQFNYFGGVWNSYNDNPNNNTSVINMAWSTNAAHADSSQSMRGWGTLRLSPTGSIDQLFGGIMTKLTPYTNDGGNAYCDISSPTGIKGISFWMKGNGKRLSVVLKSLAITNYDDYLFTIEHTPSNAWKRYYLPLADFYQEGWGNIPVLKEEALSVVNAIQFKFASKINNETNEVFIDDLSLYGGSVQYSANAVYHKNNTVSMEGFGGLLQNGTFDGPGAPGWTMATIAANENWGEWMLVMEHWNGATSTTGECYQIVSNGITAGQSYKFDIQAQSAAGYSGRAAISLVWMNSSGAALSTNEVEITSGLSQAQFNNFTTGWQTAPANATKVRVGFKSWASTVPPYTDNCVKFDNAFLLKQGSDPDSAWITTWTNGFTVTYTTNRAEGEKAMQIGTSLATPGWLAGFAVAPYGQGVTMTNFSNYSGFSIKARRAVSYKTTGATNAQFRIAVCQGTNDQPAAKCRWIPVDASVWGDSIVISKDKFYTTATVDDNNPANWAVWSNSWTDIGRIVIEYGPEYVGADPYDLLLDDFRPCNGTYLH
jgi:hypothetical protein